MRKTKLLLGLAVVISALATAATPALAVWQSLPTKAQTTTGKIRILKAGEFAAAFNGIATAFKCEAAHIEAEWQIRSTGKILEEFKGPGQQPTKRGPHDQIVIRSWGTGTRGNGSCHAEAGGAKEALEVAPCTLQIHQSAGQLTGIPSDQVTECLIKALGCEIKIPPVTTETKGENWQLGGVTLENNGENQNDKANIFGIKATASGIFCLASGETHSAELKEFEWEQEKMVAV